MDLGLQGKHAIVTGGSRGIGKAIARELAREGVDVAIVARNEGRLEATARELGAETDRRIIPWSPTSPARSRWSAWSPQAAQQLGGLHILVNSGSAPGGSATATGPIETVVDEDLLDDFNVKYVGALRCARAAIPHMKTQGWGRIINISGTNARNAGNLSGGARNTSLVHLTKTLAVQLGRFGITVNCIHPGHDAHRAHAAACSRRAPPSSASRRRRPSGRTSPPIRRAAMRSAAWWTRRRSRTSRPSWPRTRPGRSAASWSWRPAAPGGRCITDPGRVGAGPARAAQSGRLRSVRTALSPEDSGPAPRRA